MYVVALAVQDCVASVRQGTAGAVTEGMFSLLSTAAPQVEQLAGLDKWFMELARESWLTILVLGCVLPAVGEELFFRGFLGRGLVGRYGQPLGVLLTSLAFGLFHLAPERIVAATILGISLHIVYLSAKSLYAPMILHGLNNFLALGISHWFQDGTLNPSMGAEEMFFPWSLPLFGMITLVVLLAVVCLGRIQSHRLIVRKSWVMWIRPSSTIAAWPTCSLASTIERLPTCPRPFNSIPAIPLR
jgi:membrane protease YdiL (CAAX protease family)